MDKLSRGTKRSLPDSFAAESSPGAKRRRSDEEQGIAETLSALAQDTAPLQPFDVVHAIGVINIALLKGERWLDLSALPAAALAGVPGDALDPAIGRIESLVLPDPLVALPSFCNRMRSLQVLHLRGYQGRLLDLTGLPALSCLQGSVHSALDEIWLNDSAAIELSAPGRISKIRCFRVRDDMVIGMHALPGHAYYKTLAGQHLPDLRNLNHSACIPGTRTLINCSDITQHVNSVIGQKDAYPKDTYFGIADAFSLAMLTDDETRKNFTTSITMSTGHHYVDDTHFGLWAAQQLAQMKAGAAEGRDPGVLESRGCTRVFYALTGKHALSLVLRYKPGEPEQFAARLMDPNQTLTHRRIEENLLSRVNSATRPWQISRLLPDGAARHYLPPAARPAWLLVDATRRSDGERAQLELGHLVEINGDVLYTLSLCAQGEAVAAVGRQLLDAYRSGKADAASLFATLTAERQLDTPGAHCFALQLILYSGFADVALAYVRVIADFARAVYERGCSDVASGQLPADFSHRLLRPGEGPTYGITSLYLSQMSSPAAKQATFSAYAEGLCTMLDEQLIPTDACAKLLAEPWASRGILEHALIDGDATTFAAFGKVLLRLHRDRAIDLAQCREFLGSPAATLTSGPLLWTVCRRGWTPVLQACADLINELALQEHMRAPASDLIDFFDANAVLPEEETVTRIRRVLLDPLLFGTDTGVAAPMLTEHAASQPLLRPALERLVSCLRGRSAAPDYGADVLSG